VKRAQIAAPQRHRSDRGSEILRPGPVGDYTAVAPGGLASGVGTGSLPVMYFAGMFARSDGAWQTATGRNSFSAITQP